MLYAKISPAAQVIKQNGPFDTTVISADYVTVVAKNYIMGGSETEFIISYGVPVYNEDQKFLGCNVLLNDQIKLTKEETANWGTDDTYIFNLVAEKKGFTIVEFIDTDTN